MKVLVTGGAGFIGSYVVDLLIEKGETVYSVDDLSGGYWRNVNSKCKFNKLNLVNKRKTKDYIEKVRPEIIIIWRRMQPRAGASLPRLAAPKETI